jgi:heme/copper-type cytochrome/quinol oxidase subunit 4
MNSLPLDTWIRLIVWMSIGLVVYFAYSYKHSNLRHVTNEVANQSDSQNSPPIAAIIAIVLAILLTLYQVPYLMGLSSEAIPLNLGIRLFAWIVTGVLIAMLMYGKQDNRGGSDDKIQKIGLIVSVANLLVWAGITYWFFVHYAELHGG